LVPGLLHFIIGKSKESSQNHIKTIKKVRTAYTILCVRPNFWGKLAIDNEGLNITIHEFCHTYCNPVVYENRNMLESPGI
jgi:hypothetical protein